MNMPQVITTYFALKGGLDLISPPLSIPDGAVRDSLNFDAKSEGGYERIGGYERYSGHTPPSSATYAIIQCTISGSISVGNTITGQTSSATAVVIALEDDAIVVAKVSGTFASAENILVGTTVVAVSTSSAQSSSAQSSSAETQRLNALYKSLAANSYRNDISAVPGSGPVRGVWRYKGVVYAFRDNSGASACLMYKSSSSGWQLVSLNHEISFTNANSSVNEGDTLTQGGVTATILRVVVETGSLASGVNTGRLIIGFISGGSFSNASASTTGSGSLTLSGAQTAITIPNGGKYSFVNYNFTGSTQTLRMYGANGVGRAFEFDGSVFVPISTGMSTDIPKYIAAHVNYLFLSFGGSLQKSVVGEPYVFDAVLGAGELAIGDNITGLMPVVGTENTGAMVVTTTSKTAVLYGNSNDTFQLTTYSLESGAFDYSMQNIGQAYMFDEMGGRQLAATQDFGNFNDLKFTERVRPFTQPRASSFSCSCISRLKNQYRVYYSDGYGLHVTFKNKQIVGVMPIKTADSFYCMSSNESGDGDEWILAGGTDGFVYRLDKGTSFDGENISAYLSMAFSHNGSPRTRKRYRKAVYEVTGSDYAEINASYELGYGSVDISNGVTSAMETPFGQVYWDSFFWDNFYWDGRTLLPIEHSLDGTAENISLYLTSNNAYTAPFTINSVILHYSVRRQLR
jgi:hypothetical protein